MRRLMILIALAMSAVLGLAGAAAANHWSDKPEGSLHWADNDPSYPRGYVYWVDLTGPEWPVYASSIEWDKAGSLDAVYVSSEASCPSHCVTVDDVSVGTAGSCTGTIGATTRYWNSVAHLTTSTNVKLDDDCAGASYDLRRTDACHELGHSLGMGEQYVGTESCMHSPYEGPKKLPSQHDYDAIAAHYNHND